MADDDDGDEEFAPAQEIVFRLDRVTDDLDTCERLLSERAGIPVTDEERRRMRALLDRITAEVDELFDIATAAAHVQAKIEKGTN